MWSDLEDIGNFCRFSSEIWRLQPLVIHSRKKTKTKKYNKDCRVVGGAVVVVDIMDDAIGTKAFQLRRRPIMSCWFCQEVIPQPILQDKCFSQTTWFPPLWMHLFRVTILCMNEANNNISRFLQGVYRKPSFSKFTAWKCLQIELIPCSWLLTHRNSIYREKQEPWHFICYWARKTTGTCICL